MNSRAILRQINKLVVQNPKICIPNIIIFLRIILPPLLPYLLIDVDKYEVKPVYPEIPEESEKCIIKYSTICQKLKMPGPIVHILKVIIEIFSRFQCYFSL